jgi:hypothetical protein
MQLIGSYPAQALHSAHDVLNELSRYEESDLQAPAPGTGYADHNIHILTANGDYRLFNARMHVGGFLGADLRQESTMSRAYFVISLLRLDKGKETSEASSESSRPNSGRIRQSPPQSGLKLPPFSAISAGLHEPEPWSPWQNISHTPSLARPRSSSSSTSSPRAGSAAFSYPKFEWLDTIPEARSRSLAIPSVHQTVLPARHSFAAGSVPNLRRHSNSSPVGGRPFSLQDIPEVRPSFTREPDGAMADHRLTGLGVTLGRLPSPKETVFSSDPAGSRRGSSPRPDTRKSSGSRSILEGWNPVENE